MEAVFRHHLQKSSDNLGWILDSAGTSDWHTGNAPDPRSIASARKFGFDITSLRARQIAEPDFNQFDWILCADRTIMAEVRAIQPIKSSAKVELFLPWCGLNQPDTVPDPYFGHDDDFETVVELVNRAAGFYFSQNR